MDLSSLCASLQTLSKSELFYEYSMKVTLSRSMYDKGFMFIKVSVSQVFEQKYLSVI